MKLVEDVIKKDPSVKLRHRLNYDDVHFENIEEFYKVIYHWLLYDRAPGTIPIYNKKILVGNQFTDVNKQRCTTARAWDPYKGVYTYKICIEKVDYILLDSENQVMDVEKVWEDYRKYKRELYLKKIKNSQAQRAHSWKLKRAKHFSSDPVTNQRFKRYHLTPIKTTSERRQWYRAVDELSEFPHVAKLPRARRNPRNLPSAWDAKTPTYYKSWKAFRPKQRKG